MSCKLKKIRFTQEMENDFNEIKHIFKLKFGIEPSNTKIQGFLLDVFKNQELEYQQKPRRKNEFIIRW